MTPLFHRHLLSLSKAQVPLASLFESLFARNGRFNIRVSEIVVWGLLPYRNSLYGFRTFCTGEDLTTKICVPCNMKDLRPMAKESAHHLMPKVGRWDLVNEGGILMLKQSLKVKSFTNGLELFNLVAGHHTDLHLVRWNNVIIEIWTHAIGGLTENDSILAAKINKLDLHHLLRKNISA